MKMQKLLPIALALSLLLAGCAMFRFETTEEIRQREALQQKMMESAVLLTHTEMLTGESTITRELKNENGDVLALYQASVPTFSAEGVQEAACQRMTEYYAAEFAEYAADCEAFFETVKRQYGEEWETAVPNDLYTATFTYQLMESPLRYLCVNRTYVYTQPEGNGYTMHYPDIFLAENGWRLEFNDLFGLNAAAATELTMREIGEWCAINEIPHERLDDLTIEDFWSHFAMTRDHLIFYVLPFTMSTNDNRHYEIALDLGLYAKLLTESIEK